MKAYCYELENIATSLNNLGASISDNRLALQVLHGLTRYYCTFRSLVQHMSPVPSFDTLRPELELEEHSHHQDVSSPHDSALVTTSKPLVDHSIILFLVVALITVVPATTAVVAKTVVATTKAPIPASMVI